MSDRKTAFLDHFALFWKTYAGVAAVVVFGLGIHFVLDALWVSKSAKDWPTVDAYIAESSVSEHPQYSDVSMQTFLVAKLVLEYEAGGECFRNPVFRRWNRKVPTDYVAELATGKTITIRFDPEEPKIVSLVPVVPD